MQIMQVYRKAIISKDMIILLNGVSSAGKTTLAHILQDKLELPYYYLAQDAFCHLVSQRHRSADFWSLTHQSISAMHHTIACFSRLGLDVIVDHVLLDTPQTRGWLQECVQLLHTHPVLFIEVYCPLEELERREMRRGNRRLGQARAQIEHSYDPNTNRMVSPDIIVPDSKDPQSFNRYSYALNNPVKYTDPSGHCVFVPPFDTAVCIALLALALTGDSEQPPIPDNYPNHTTLSRGCTDTLANCFQARSIREFEDYEQIGQQEFNDLLDAVAEDLYTHDIPTNLGGQWAAGRGAYDTPFYNGEGRGGLPPGQGYDSNQQVCLDQGCFGRSEVNYIAQGMWAAAGGYSLDEALDQTEAWNELSYGQDASPGKSYWTEFGYNWYIEWIQQQEE